MLPRSYTEKAHGSHLFVVLDDGSRLFFDVYDGSRIESKVARSVDFYFKRSLTPDHVPPEFRAVVHPLGFNFPVFPDGFDVRELFRDWHLRRSRSESIRAIAKVCLHGLGSTLGGFRATMARVSSAPQKRLDPRVLFMVRAWDPQEVVSRSEVEAHQRELINDTRAACIRLLRRELGGRFTGGFAHTDFARRRYSDLLVSDPASTTKERYVQLLAEHPICVATVGLHGSVGWKLGEYVAASKAILSEPVVARVPGDFAEPTNYLSFRDASECVARALELIEKTDLRCAMMEQNQAYYQRHLRPDQLVANALAIVRSGPI